jgi:WD40 repeat protein
MEIIKSKSVKKPIVLMKILDDGTLVDRETTIRFFDKKSLNLLDGFKVNIHHLRYKTSVVAFSDNAEFFATLTADCKESRLYNVKTKKIVSKVNRHQGEVSCVGIDPSAKYMFSCGDDGKTFAMDLKSGKLVFTLPAHADTINDIAFSENSNWVATASYDKKISLFNLVTMTPKDKLKAHASPIMKLRFFNKNRLLSIDKNSTAIIWNIYSGKILARLQGIHDDVTQITTSGDDKFLFMGTALGYVLVYDLDTYELLSSKYIKITSPITALEFDKENNHLMVGTEDGFLMYYNIYEGEDKLKELLKYKKFQDIQKEAQINPILAYTKIFDIVSNLWEHTLEKAKFALQNGERNKAIALFQHFKDIPSKNRIMQKIIRDYAEFEKFTKFAKEGKISLAYGLANTYPVYKESKIYKSLEARWKKAFAQAQKYALNPKGTEQVKQILAPYRGISEKTKLIQDLLTKGEVYKRFRVAIGQKEFRICFELIKQHPFLKEFPEYDTLIKYADTLYIKSQKLIYDGDTHSAIKMLRILLDFTDFRDEVKQLMKDIELKQKFFNAIKENDIASAYNMMDISEDLQDTNDGKRLQKEWKDALSIASSYAVEGDAENLKESLQKYLKISSKHMALATVFSLCYMVQLDNALKDKIDRQILENGIKNYMLHFGFQDQIESFYESFKQSYPDSKLHLAHLPQGSLSMWRPSMTVSSILD